jgi:Kef-type K+ transport system membrane component KefB/voltage-gated potassium channel Kch
MHAENVLADIGIAIIAATVLAYVARLLRQPVLLAYIAAGLVIGPPGVGLVHNTDLIAQLSELGLAFLMFIVGLEIDLKKLVHSGRVGALVGTIQVLLSALMAVVVMQLLGFTGLPAVYLGVASAFSSTMIVVKLLSDKSELDTVNGRLTLGVLLVQDVLAIVVLALQPSLQNPSLLPIGLSILSGLALVAGSLAAARFILPRLLQWAAKSPEIVLISAVSWCLLVGYVAIRADFSVAMGALIAGVTLSAFPYTLDVVAKIRGLRDFFVTLFFVSLGMQLEVGATQVVGCALVLSIVVLATRFLTVGPTLQLLGYGSRVGVLCSLALAQAGEFALVIASVGFSLGHIGREVVSIVALTLVVTSTLSTYMVMANHRIAKWLTNLLDRLGVREWLAAEGREGSRPAHEVLLLGFHRVASSLLHLTQGTANGRPLLIVDFSPEVLQRLRTMNVPVVYGDISHLDTLEHAGLEHARVILSTVSDDFLRGTSNTNLLRTIRHLNPTARVILSAETIEAARRMYAAGADYVVLPRFETARAFLDVLETIERGELDDLRARARADLDDREEVLA